MRSDRFDTDNKRVMALRSSISELGEQLDSYKSATAGALGGAAFLLLLAACGAYDLAAGKSGIWLAVGLSGESVRWLTGLLAAAGVLLLGLGLFRQVGRDRSRESRLAEMEEELAVLSNGRTEPEGNSE